MSILVDKTSRVLIQGFTGKEATFHAQHMIQYGTVVVGGVTPNKGGQIHLDRPVFNTVSHAIADTNANVSILFVPAAGAADAIMEAADSQIELIICITEGIPLYDMMIVKQYLKQHRTRLIGPNCPGIISTEEAKIGILPDVIFQHGRIGIVSRSGTLTYEAAEQVVQSGYGISTAIGIGGDPILGTSMQEVVALFMEDSQTDAIIIIGEIGGMLEVEAANWIYNTGNKKPVIGFVAGKTAPEGRTMGHAGAIIGKKEETAEEKIKIMKACDVYVVDSPIEIGTILQQVLS